MKALLIFGVVAVIALIVWLRLRKKTDTATATQLLGDVPLNIDGSTNDLTNY